MTRRDGLLALATPFAVELTDAAPAFSPGKLNVVCVGGHPDDPEQAVARLSLVTPRADIRSQSFI